MKRLFVRHILSAVYAWPLLADDEPLSQQPKADALNRRAPTVEDTTFDTPLTELGCMIGRWFDCGENATITTNRRWNHCGQFLSRSFVIAAKGEATLKGTQVIGWDPIARDIRSWTFDSA